MKNDRSRACMAKNKSEVCRLFITRAAPFVQFIRPSVVMGWNGYCIKEKKAVPLQTSWSERFSETLTTYWLLVLVLLIMWLV